MNPATERYLDQYQALKAALPGHRVGWLQAQRSAGLARFEKVGFPTQRDEDWRYTATGPITAKTFQQADAPQVAAESLPKPLDIKRSDIEQFQIKGLQSHQLVFVDGLFAPSLSDLGELGDGVVVDSLARVLEERPELIEQTLGTVKPRKAHGFTALNNAHSRDGVVVLLAAGARPTAILELLFISETDNGFAQPRNLIIAADASHAQFIERHVSAHAGASFTNSVTEVLLGAESEVDYYLMQDQSAAAYQVCGVWARQGRGSRFRCRTATLGGALVRNDLGVELAGEGAHCDMLGLYHLTAKQHVDNHTTMTHRAKGCSSRELYQGVLNQRSRAVFHGRIKVEPGAQKTDAAQTNNNLLLSKDAEIDCKPQLEIYADDVKCAHGATVGRLDDDALFYLRSRGIEHAQARALLTSAFVGDVVGEIKINPLRAALESRIAERLGGNGAINHPTTDSTRTEAH